MSGFLTHGWQVSRIIANKVSTSATSVTSSTTLVPITGLQHKLQNGMSYVFSGHITLSAGASGGVKVALVGDGILTAQQFTATALTYTGTTLSANSTTTTLGSAIGAATAAATDIYIEGSIVVGVPGNIMVEIAQNASNATATTAQVGSMITFSPVD